MVVRERHGSRVEPAASLNGSGNDSGGPHGPPDDPRIRAAVARIKDGDKEAAGFLYERYASHVRRYAQWMLGDRDVADDVTQIVFLRLLTKAHLYRPRSAPFETWLLRVTHNVALDEVRRRRLEVACEPAAHDRRAVVDDGLGSSLCAALQSLPTAQREVVIMRLVLGLSAAETACRLARTEASVNNLQHRGRENLRRLLTGLSVAPRTTTP